MTSIPQSMQVREPQKIAGRGGLVDRYFYLAVSLLIVAIIVYGFSLTINSNLIHPAFPRPWLLWVHAAAFSAWLPFFILQCALIRARSVRLHRILGWFGAGLGALMPVLGVAIAVVMDRFHIYRLHDQTGPETEAFFVLQLNDMVTFAAFLALAVYWRRKPNVHRRLMLIATCALTTAGFGRFPSLAIQNVWFYPCVDALILLGPLRDLVVERHVHHLYRIALPALAVTQGLAMYLYLRAVPGWIRIAHSILG